MSVVRPLIHLRTFSPKPLDALTFQTWQNGLGSKVDDVTVIFTARLPQNCVWSGMASNIEPEFLDIVNYAICQAVNAYMDGRASEFFRKVGEYHLEEALRRGLVRIEPSDKPLDVLLKIAKYLESHGYMEQIHINRIDDKAATVEMFGVSVADSSARLLAEKKQPSHYMTNIMFAALKRLGVQAELRDMEYNREQKHFKEYWKIL